MTTLANPEFDTLVAHVRANLCAKYEASEALKSEFICAEDYAAYEMNTTAARAWSRRWRTSLDAEAAEKAFVASEVRDNVRKGDARRAAGRLRLAR